jgi:hypothetical protein
MAMKQIEHGWIPQTTDDRKTTSGQQTKCRRNFTCLASEKTLPHKLVTAVDFSQLDRLSHAFGPYENDTIDRIGSSVASQAIENRINPKTRKAVSSLSSSFGSACAVFSARVIFRS